MSLADVQAAIRDVVVAGRAPAPWLDLDLVGGSRPSARLEIHRRHYRASLIEALRSRFPASAWLLGDVAVLAAAEAFVRVHPPGAPCIAEYGEAFPRFLARMAGAAAPYARSFAELEWAVGQVSIATAEPPPVTIAALAGIPAERLADAILLVQPGVRYLRAEWPVDTLFRFFLEDSAPESYPIAPEVVGLEVRGARGEFAIERLAPGRLALREALAHGAPLGAAMLRASAVETGLDPATELGALLADGLVTGIQPAPGQRP